MDVGKLTPAPWGNSTSGDYVFGPTGYPLLLAEDSNDEGEAACAFAALARNAFDGDPEALAWWEANRKRRENVETQDWYETNGCTHAHCPNGCEKSWATPHGDRLLCYKCLYEGRGEVEMVPCVPATCED